MRQDRASLCGTDGMLQPLDISAALGDGLDAGEVTLAHKQTLGW